MDEVRVFFTYPSPFCYLAWHRIQAHPERYATVRIRWVPILFRRLMALEGGPAGGSPPLQLAYNYADAARWANHYGIPMATPHRRDPTNQAAHKVHLLAQDAGGEWERRWMAAVHHMARVEGRDITDGAAVEQMARQMGLPGIDRIAHPSLDDRLEANTQEALQADVCGVPFAVHGSEAYWGNDRLAWLEARLAGRPLPDLI